MLTIKKIFFCFLLLFGISFISKAQDIVIDKAPDSLSEQKDLIDVARKMFNIKPKDKPASNHALTVLPAIGYNPSTGFLFGIKFLKTSQRGDVAKTKLSIAQLDLSYTTKRLLILRLRHNIFTANDKWNFQGDWQYMRFFVNDFGLGKDARRDPPANYPIRFNYFRFTEKAYRNLGNNLYGGAGVSFDLRNDIHDEKLDSNTFTPHYQYSIDNGFNYQKYNANGVILNLQYNTREHPNRSFGGVYAEMYFRYNTKVLGSTKEAGQLYAELRKYWSLSKKNPEHVIAFWYWGSYLLWGKLPYLELPSTEYDTYNRSGRGYTLGRFRGLNFTDLEAEYRIPISKRTKLLSAVIFGSVQTGSDGKTVHLFDYLEPAAGAGLRVLFTKKSRTNICLDYAWGRYGSSGIFFALNEAF